MRKKSEQIRNQILEAAKESIVENGYAATSIKNIAMGAGVSPATIYSYFASKQELFDTLDLDEKYLEYHPAKEKKRNEIISTALLMFGEKGYESTTLEAIMGRMNMGKTSIYQFFDSKEELFAEVLHESKVNLQARRLRNMPRSSDWKKSTTELGKAYLEMGYDPLREAIFKTVLQQSANQPEFGRLYHEKGKGTTTVDLAHFLQPYQEQGIIRQDIDLNLASFLFLCSLWGYNITFKYIKGATKEYTDEDVLRHATKLFFDGICQHPT